MWIFWKIATGKKTSKFVKLIDDLFDLSNTSTKFGAHPGCNAFGVNLTDQF